MDYCDYFKGKKITVMGLGLLGRGVGDAALIAGCGAEVVVTDLKSEAELAESVQKLQHYPNITFALGEHRLEDFESKDFILVAAGVPLESEYLAHARANNIPLKQSAALFAELSGIPIIGVTGTRGKSTVTHMIHHVLSQTTEGAPVLLGGNVRGLSNLQLLKQVEEGSVAVMELDSWQLQGFGWAEISPHIAVFTTFMDDHLNYYMKGDRTHDEAMDLYFADKAQIFLHQEDSGVFVTTPAVFERAKQFAAGKNITLSQEVVLTDASALPEDCLLKMPGEHNRLNAALAYEALKATSLPEELIMEGLASFPGVPGRLEYLGEWNGVKIYNDNNATTPNATAAGIEAVASGKNVVLLAGGSDKNIDLAPLVDAIEAHVDYLILYSGTGTEKLKAILPEAVQYEEHEMLKDCVEAALACAKEGNVFLFSPGFSSFGKYYKNEYDRNDQFVALINERLHGQA